MATSSSSSSDTYGPANWAIPIVIPATFRKTATVNAATFGVAFIPSIFVLYCVIRRTDLFTKYKTNIMFSWIVQSVFTIPIFLWNTFTAIFAWQDIPTTLGLCTWFKGLTGFFFFGSFMSVTAVAIGRHLSIVWRKHIGVWHLSALTALFSSPCFAHPMIYIFFGAHTTNDNCSRLNYSPFIIIAQAYYFYILSIVLIGTAVNISTLIFLINHFKNQPAGVLNKDNISRNELSVSISLTLQCLAPVITMGTSAVSNAFVFSGVKLGDTLTVVVNVISGCTAGVNILCSVIFIRTFRRMIVEIFRPGRSGTTNNVSTSNIKTISHKVQ